MVRGQQRATATTTYVAWIPTSSSRQQHRPGPLQNLNLVPIMRLAQCSLAPSTEQALMKSQPQCTCMNSLVQRDWAGKFSRSTICTFKSGFASGLDAEDWAGTGNRLALKKGPEGEAQGDGEHD
ncbi:hypothetical protein P8C59_004925 [Phyllachora maydis]|uniref:Uncharacterized protein n=1 Tax=Phyllachora maydis TaxID=1825666 RepID=A0AAD9I4H7_9PEZI|nr:hypothetical protein P8C59_004925 [Phyllachora maydis]